MVFLKSIIGPKIKKARIAGEGKIELNEAPINASASEQSESIKARAIMTNSEDGRSLPMLTSVLVDRNV